MIIKKDEKKSSLLGSLLMVLAIITVFGVCIIKYKFEAHVPISICIGLLIIYGCIGLKIEWADMSKSMVNSISTALECMLIILAIGATVGTWIAAGIVPYIITLGLNVMSAKNYLVSAFCVCTVMSMCTGSSWTTMGTIGVAFMGVGTALGINPAMSAGAIVCGAYIGDTQSPLSDQTNFSSSITGVNLYKHLKSMLYTTAPTFVICVIVFYILGFQIDTTGDVTPIKEMVSSLESNFNFTPILLLPFVVMLIMILAKVPAFPTLLFCSIIGIVFSVIIQKRGIEESIIYWYSGFISTSGNETIDSLLSRGGITSMWYTLTLMLLSLSLAGVLERCGIIDNLVNGMYRFISGVLSLTIIQLISEYILSFVASDPYLAMLLPAKAFNKKYEELGCDKAVLSRTLENGATIVAPMVPWGSNGVYCSTALGISTLEYIPYYFMGVITPFVCIICCATGFGMFRNQQKNRKETSANNLNIE